MKYFSMFSGIGGFELGIQRAFDNRQETDNQREGSPSLPQDGPNNERNNVERPISCIGYSEIDKYAIETYEHNWKGHKNYGDATLINERQLPDFDLLVGGFPCQAFSVAGKRHGFNDTRGTLFFDIARILSHKRPRHFLLENVKGLLSHDSGKTFQTILGVLSDLGYDVEWQVLNAKDFGVPQNRERVFIVGHLGGECGRQVFPISGANSQTSQEYIGSIGTPRKGTEGQEHLSRAHKQPARVYSPEGISPTISSQETQGRYNIIQLNKPTHSNDRVYADDGISPTLNTAQGGNRQPFIAPVLTPDRLEKRQNGRRFKTNGEPSFTLNTQDKHGIYDGARIRRLTPTECERLMSWPDGWTIGSDTQRYKQCGNGVVSNVVQAVVEKMKPCLGYN